jgi:CRP-like cAMP-binding protein
MTEAAAFLHMRKTFSRWADIRDGEWRLLQSLFRFHPVAKSESVLVPGQRPKDILYVASGLLRYYYGGNPDGEGRGSNKVFLSDGMFSAPITGCALDPEPGCGVEALEAGDLLIADASAFNALYDVHPVFDRLGRRMGEWWLGQKELRARSFQLQDARDRYLGFIRTHGDLVQRIPQYHVASYLGITDVSLSRIRRDLSRTGPNASSFRPQRTPVPPALSA